MKLEINLLPEELKKKRESHIKLPSAVFIIFPLVIVALALSLFIHIGLIFAVNMKKAALEAKAAQWREIQPEKNELEKTIRERAKIKHDIALLDNLIEERILWSEKLNSISNLALPGMWFTELSINKKTLTAGTKEADKFKRKLTGRALNLVYLYIEGAVTSRAGEELAVIGKFIEELKNSENFIKDFSDIELETTELKTVKGNEVMKFKIHCYLNKRKG